MKKPKKPGFDWIRLLELAVRLLMLYVDITRPPGH